MLLWWRVTWEFFYIFNSTWVTTSKCVLVVIDTVDGEDNLEEKTREAADIRMCHFGWNCLQLGRDMLWWLGWHLSFYTFIMSDNIKKMCFGGRRHSGRQGLTIMRRPLRSVISWFLQLESSLLVSFSSFSTLGRASISPLSTFDVIYLGVVCDTHWSGQTFKCNHHWRTF